MVNTLKDYAIQALVNTIDHLGSVTFKVNGLLDEQVDEVSETELRVSCIEQVLLCFLVILFSIILLRWIFVLGISSSKRCLNSHIPIWCSFFCALFVCGASYKLPLSSLHSIESTENNLSSKLQKRILWVLINFNFLWWVFRDFERVKSTATVRAFPNSLLWSQAQNTISVTSYQASYSVFCQFLWFNSNTCVLKAVHRVIDPLSILVKDIQVFLWFWICFTVEESIHGPGYGVKSYQGFDLDDEDYDWHQLRSGNIIDSHRSSWSHTPSVDFFFF